MQDQDKIIGFIREMATVARQEGLVTLRVKDIEIHLDPTHKPQKELTPEEKKETEEWIKKLQELTKPVSDEEILFGVKGVK